MTAPTPPPTAPGRPTLRTLRRLRWAVRGTLMLGVAASVTANVLHAEPHPISQAIAAWPSLALLLTVELIARIPVTRAGIAVARLAATAVVAAIAAWVSYWHMAGVAAKYGETGITPYLLPISVDGLILIASISLLEISARIRTIEAATHAMPSPQPAPEPATSPVGAATTSQPSRPRPPTTPPAPHPDLSPTPPDMPRPRPAPARPIRLRHDAPATADRRPTPPADDQPPADTAAAVAYWRHRQPHLQAEDIARLIGRSARTVYRYLPKTVSPTAPSTPDRNPA